MAVLELTRGTNQSNMFRMHCFALDLREVAGVLLHDACYYYYCYYGGIYDGLREACRVISETGTTPITLKGAVDMYRCVLLVLKP
eukprot:359158-Amphidinium_carterae.1